LTGKVLAEGQSRDAGAYAGRPSVCRHCGALIGAGESRCMMCGTPVAQATEAQARAKAAARPDPETLRFLRAVISRPATFTFLFIIANVFVYVLMWLSGGATGSVLIAYGAKLNHLIDEGQWWRFVTPIFLHVQLPIFEYIPVHLLANMYGLFMLGPYVEKLYGSAKFVVFWVLTGVAGVAASYLTVRPELAHGSLGRFLFKPFDTPSAGASGALFGLIGVLFVFGLKYRHELPEGLKRAFGTGMLPTILINLFIGYAGRGFIDNAAHLGGLVSGMALALVVGYKRPGEGGSVAIVWHVLQVACLVLVIMSFVMVGRHFDAPTPRLDNLPQRIRTAGRSPVVAFVEGVNDGRNALDRFLEGDSAALAPAATKLEDATGLSASADALRNDLKTLIARARVVSNDKTLKQDERVRRMEQIASDYKTWNERFDEWAESEGSEFGIRIQKPETQKSER
jgi:rhomboid protease GluP